jgi:predicted  nucleic acid-binding Zn-ribbon protein
VAPVGMESSGMADAKADLAGLIEAQKIDRELRLYMQERDSWPSRLSAHEDAVASAKKSVADSLLADRDATKQIDALNVDLAEIETHKKKLESQRTGARNERELAAFDKELNDLKQKNNELEEKTLQFMEAMDARAKNRPVLEARVAQAIAELNHQKVLCAKHVESLEGDIRNFAEKRASVLASVEPERVADYEKLLTARDGKAVVPVSERICQGCFRQLTQHDVQQIVMHDEIRHCPGCGRIHYVQGR